MTTKLYFQLKKLDCLYLSIQKCKACDGHETEIIPFSLMLFVTIRKEIKKL